MDHPTDEESEGDAHQVNQEDSPWKSQEVWYHLKKEKDSISSFRIIFLNRKNVYVLINTGSKESRYVKSSSIHGHIQGDS